MLGCRFYLGIVTFRDEEFPGQHEGIIERELFERVRTRTVKRGPGHRTIGRPRGLLAGIVRCARCGKRLQAHRNGSGNSLYRERRAGEHCVTEGRSCVASRIDPQIGDLFGSLVVPQDWKEKIARQSVKTEGPSISELQEDRRRLGYSYRLKTMTQEEFDRELEEIDTKLRMAQISTPIELDDVAELLGNLPTLWREATTDERSRLLHTLVEAVYVDIDSKRIVAIAPVPAFRTLVESAIERTADPSAVLVDPDEVENPEIVDLVETGEELKRRHPLLSIDNVSTVDMLRPRGDLLEHECAQEVRARSLRGLDVVVASTLEFVEVVFGYVPDILPERFPAIVLRPDIWALKGRDRVADLLLEEVLWGEDVSVHEGLR